MTPAGFSIGGGGAMPTSRMAASAAPTTGGSPHVIDVTEATFATDVVERSRQVPVVLDLWAAWCGPCKQLSPVLERLADEAGGAWVLAKVDVDANPRIAQALRVQGIPAVKAVVNGEIVDEFNGALPEREVREWLARLGVGDDGEPAPEPVDPRLITAFEAERAGDYEAALAGYGEVLAERPADRDAASGVARVSLFQRLQGLDPVAARAAAERDPDDVAAATAYADVLLAQGDIEGAFRVLLDVVRRTAGDERDQARKHLVTLFDVLPEGDPRVTKARRDLASALF